ncbi:MAG TPA: hypothetical protein VJJ98_01310 [Sedimentisphaerales bacterium]|nr:hypothetical protein [Sedimentisphaerales bacterium]
MRTMVGLSAVVLMLVVLSSCSGNRPEKAFMGTWKGQYDGDLIELSFMENEIWVGKTSDETSAGTWSINSDGDAQMTYDDAHKATVKLAGEGKMVVQVEGEGNAIVLEKATRKK